MNQMPESINIGFNYSFQHFNPALITYITTCVVFLKKLHFVRGIENEAIVAWETGCLLPKLEEPGGHTGLAGLRNDSSARRKRGRGPKISSKEARTKHFKRDLARTSPRKSQIPPSLLPPRFWKHAQAGLPACSPFSQPAVHPAEGRPRGREGEEWKGKDSSAGRPWPLKKTEAGRKTYCSLKSDHLRASLWVTHPGTPRPRGERIRPGRKTQRAW